MLAQGKHGKHDREACFPCFPSKTGKHGEARREAREACFPALSLQKGSTGKHRSIDCASVLPWSGVFGCFSFTLRKGKHDTTPEEALA